MTDAETIREAVIERYLAEPGQYSSAPEIAAHLKWSETRVRKVLRENFGAVAGTDAPARRTEASGGDPCT
jgi:hypothetical protein